MKAIQDRQKALGEEQQNEIKQWTDAIAPLESGISTRSSAACSPERKPGRRL